MAYSDEIKQLALKLYRDSLSAAIAIKLLEKEILQEKLPDGTPKYTGEDIPHERTLRRWVKDQRTRTQDKKRFETKRLLEGKISNETITKIEKLAEKLEQLIKVPEPELPLLDEDAEPEVSRQAMEGNIGPYLKFTRAMITPWWRKAGSFNIRLYLNYQERALLEHFLGFADSQELKAALSEWEKRANEYLKLKQYGADIVELQRSYHIADDVSHRVREKLWNAFEALRWTGMQ